MQESWQVFMKPTMSAPHVDAAFQAGVHGTTTSMAGRVLFPFTRWSDIGETDSGAHGKRTGSNLQNPAEGHGDCNVSSSMIDATQLSTDRAGQSMASGLVCTTTTEAKKAGHTTATQCNFGWMAGAAGGGEADYRCNVSAFSSPASSQLGTMAQINHINDMTYLFNSDGMNVQEKMVAQSNSKNDLQNNYKILPDDGGVTSSKCKQQHNNPTVHAVPRCQIDGCKQDLSKAKKEYHRRHKVCEMHSKASSVLKCGLHQRFCQQCSRFHVVGDFDDAKRSCRRRLEGHNRRRRKPISQGYGNLVGMNPVIQHQLMAATAMMVPFQQQVLLNQGKNNNEATNIQQILYEKKLALPKSTLPTSLDERILALLTYNTKGSSSSSSSSSTSSSSSPSTIFNHGDTSCALSLLSYHASLDQPLNRTIEENHLYPNLSSSLATTNQFTSPNTTNLASMINLSDNNSIVIECPQSSQSIQPKFGKFEPFTSTRSTKDLTYAYPLTNYLGSLQSLEQPNLIAELLRKQQAYS